MPRASVFELGDVVRDIWGQQQDGWRDELQQLQRSFGVFLWKIGGGRERIEDIIRGGYYHYQERCKMLSVLVVFSFCGGLMRFIRCAELRMLDFGDHNLQAGKGS